MAEGMLTGRIGPGNSRGRGLEITSIRAPQDVSRAASSAVSGEPNSISRCRSWIGMHVASAIAKMRTPRSYSVRTKAQHRTTDIERIMARQNASAAAAPQRALGNVRKNVRKSGFRLFTG